MNANPTLPSVRPTPFTPAAAEAAAVPRSRRPSTSSKIISASRWADLPGVPRENLDVKVHDNTLTIEADTRLDTPADLRVRHAEIRATRYARSFVLGSRHGEDRREPARRRADADDSTPRGNAPAPHRRDGRQRVSIGACRDPARMKKPRRHAGGAFYDVRCDQSKSNRSNTDFLRRWPSFVAIVVRAAIVSVTAVVRASVAPHPPRARSCASCRTGASSRRAGASPVSRNQLVEFAAIEPHAAAGWTVVDLDRLALGHQQVGRLADRAFHRASPFVRISSDSI